ncbi:High-affinity nickel-transporter [Candidatus Glomeribacter gigasporarum BEG34]|uniref:Nickel/cobalt efflux system n=1 Tax=Candidatus Glomeribacter gigasporarum BEG34 TaxID=1070319 RepID=G2JAK2_9BURK|nr:nickel transporter [Candidatus Glomeribacter gigasporarum]CCD29804.1 High-affinity nickel-transporter [Candidatus Glomeribacter gigasporarum BEG34]
MDLQTTWVALSLAFALGARHGLDPDHLIAIDNLTRYNASRRPLLARWCGFFFAMGHGMVVACAALLFSRLGETTALPYWLECLGAYFTIGVLLALGLANLYSALNARPGDIHRHIGLRASIFSNLLRVSNPWLISGVGAGFAISFDTMSQAGLLGLVAAQGAGWGLALAAALTFTIGMMTPDTFNGLIMGQVLVNPSNGSVKARRIISIIISLLSLGGAAYQLANWLAPSAFKLSNTTELGMSILLVMATFACYMTLHLSRRARQ